MEITLAKGYGPRGLRATRIKRLIKVDNTSKWFLNGTYCNPLQHTHCTPPRTIHPGADTTLAAVRDEVAEFHVQLDNLCQFLPQDRVAAFAAMRPHELLEETEKAIGNAELYDKHQQLKTMKQEITTKQSVW